MTSPIINFVDRQARTVVDKHAWLKGAATPPALFLRLSNIAMCTADDIWREDGEGALRRIPLSEMSQRGKDALKSHKSEERVLMGGGDEGTVVSRREETAVHDPLKAAQMIISLWGPEALEFARDESPDDKDRVRSRTLRIAMQPNERRFTLEDRQKDFQTKTEADYRKDLGLD